MCDSVVILRLYSCVLQEHKIKYKVTEADIRTAIQNMKEVYKPNPGSLSDTTVYVANYNDAGHRCAYLHKYAPFHTALVADMLQKAIQENWKLFEDLIYLSERINICSLGGGPGTDIFGVLSILNATFGNFQVSATIIDCMENWKDMFYDLLIQLRYGNFGALGKCVGEQYFEWKYLQHNLLSKMTNQVNQAIARANLVTMIKFVSASSCKDTPAMIRKIFRAVKPGCLILYIDNAGGGFHQMIRKEAQDCNMINVFCLNHELYRNLNFNVKRFGYTPCLETKVTVQIWRKPSQNMNMQLELNEPSEFRRAVDDFPPLLHLNQPKIAQAGNFEHKIQVQKSIITCSEIIYSIHAPESTSNCRKINKVANALSESLYEYSERIVCSQSSNSYLPEIQASITNQNFNARHIGSYSNESMRQLPSQPNILSQPRTITSTSLEPERNPSRQPNILSQPRTITATSLQPKRKPSLPSTDENCQRNVSQAPHSYMPGTQAAIAYQNSDTIRTGSKGKNSNQSSIRSQPQRITSTSLPPDRIEEENRLMGNENFRQNDDCCGCCVIS